MKKVFGLFPFMVGIFLQKSSRKSDAIVGYWGEMFARNIAWHLPSFLKFTKKIASLR